MNIWPFALIMGLVQGLAILPNFVPAYDLHGSSVGVFKESR